MITKEEQQIEEFEQAVKQLQNELIKAFHIETLVSKLETLLTKIKRI